MSDDTLNAINDKAAWTDETPLVLACRYNHREIVEYLLGVPEIEVNARDKNGFASLGVAIKNGHTEVVKRLLNEVDVDVYGRHTCFEWTNCSLLHHAAESGHEEIVKLLIEKGVDPHAIDDNSWNALHEAVQSGHTDIVKYLTRHRGNIARHN
ncbi:ankyrin, partial [Pluteus cervinus]